MIKVNELRIGNFIVDDDGAFSKVIGFKPYEHSVRCNEEEGCDILIDIQGADGKVRTGYAVESTEASPIPLTPALLYSAGFSTPHDYMSTVVSKEGVMIDYHLGKFRLRENNRITIDYLHQLQNLYFALTGEELTINYEHIQSTS